MSDWRGGPIDDYEQRVAEVRRRISELQRFWFVPLSNEGQQQIPEDRPNRPQEDVSAPKEGSK